VFREPVGTAKRTLAARREHGQVATMHETLTVWNPFADKLLALWLDTADGPRVASSFPAGWRDRAASLIDGYATLSRAHQRATKHRNPKHNLGILLAATRAVQRSSKPPGARMASSSAPHALAAVPRGAEATRASV